MSILQDKDLIGSFAESVGIKKLDKEVEDLILSDLETKVLEILQVFALGYHALQESKKIMRHSKRDFLKTNDVKLSMEKLSIPNMFGYPSSVPYSYERVQEQPNLWFIKSQTINLKEFAVKPKLNTPLATTAYKIHFEALDGIQPKTAETVEESQSLYQPRPMEAQPEQQPQIVRVDPSGSHEQEEEKKQQERQDQLQRQKLQHDQKQGKVIQLTKEFDAFYNTFIENHQKLDQCLINGAQSDFSNVDNKMAEILFQIENTPSLSAIFPHMIRYIFEKYTQMFSAGHAFIANQMQLLRIVESIIKNKEYDREKHLNQLVRLLLIIITRDLPENIPYDDNEAFQLREKAAELLSKIVQMTGSKSPILVEQIVTLVLNKLFAPDGIKTGLAFYGSLMCMKVFGTNVTKSVTIPQLKNLNMKIHHNIMNLQGNQKHILAFHKCLDLLKNQCLDLINYMKQNEASSTSLINEVTEITSSVFGN